MIGMLKLNLFASLTLPVIAMPTINVINNKESEKEISLGIDYKDLQGLWVDAGKSPWVWEETSATTKKEIGSTKFQFDLDDYMSVEKQANAKLVIDMHSSFARSSNSEASDAYFQGENPIININQLSSYEKTYFLGKTSNAKVGSDLINGSFEINISKDDDNVVEFDFLVTAYAFNSRNGNVNTAGKGHVHFALDQMYLVF